MPELTFSARSSHSLIRNRTAGIDPTSSFHDPFPILRSGCSRNWGAACRAPNFAVRLIIACAQKQSIPSLKLSITHIPGHPDFDADLNVS